LEELVSKAKEWETLSEEPSLSAFLEELSLKSTLDEVGETEDRINLMTLHNGKGLEFQAVFLVGMEEDLFPHANSKSSHEALEEERRLCYVGMTRAKEYLYFTAAETRYLWGTSRFMRPSRFLSEIPQSYIRKVRSPYQLPFDE
jgi:DNA helicase-2/ATP-dependent DNA helicase PcrA